MGIVALVLGLGGTTALARDEGPPIRIDGIRYEALGSGYSQPKICKDTTDGKLYYLAASAHITVKLNERRVQFPISVEDFSRLIGAGYGKIRIDGAKEHVNELDLKSELPPAPRQIFQQDLSRAPYKEIFDHQSHIFSSCEYRQT